MAKRRKTKGELITERVLAEQSAWERFRHKLDGLKSYVEAQLLAKSSPPVDRPGRGYYTNLKNFLVDFNIPAGSSYEEKALYLQFIQRLDAAGALKPGEGPKIQQALQAAMAKQGPS